MERIEVGKTYTRDELKRQGMREVGALGCELVFSDGTRRLLWDPGTHQITLALNDDKRYATF